MGLISLITPHADRPQAIGICEQYIRRLQIPDGYQIEWVLVDGGTESRGEVTPDVYVQHRAPQHPAQNLCSNFLRAIKVANGEFILVIEDDDWYHPEYLCHMVELLKSAQMVGLTRSRYYHLGRRQYRVLRNKGHSSLCSTGFRADLVTALIPRVKQMIVKREKYIDIDLWQNTECIKALSNRHELCLGIKGVPGKAGVSAAHRSEDDRWIDDLTCEWFRNYIGGQDFKRYLPFMQATREDVALHKPRVLPVHWRKDREFNFGDRMAAVIAEHLSGGQVQWSSANAQAAYYTTVGSFLQIVNQYAEVWGTGLLDSRHTPCPEATYHAVRGPLTREAIVKAGGYCPEKYGDPVMLCPRIYPKRNSSDRVIGICPQWREQSLDLFRNKSDRSVKILDVRSSPETFCRELSACDAVASSSLHGLVAAHSYGIPAVWIKPTDKPLGDGFKFRDYLLSVGCSDQCLVPKSKQELFRAFDFVETPQKSLLTEFIGTCPFLSGEYSAISSHE